MSLHLIIQKHVLKNALEYGKANPGSVVGKVIGEFPEAKNDMKKTMQEINTEISRVAKLTKNEIEKEMSKFEYAEKKEAKKTLILPDAVEGKIITRFPPEPSGYPHIGHAKAAWLDYEAARAYGGKMILRFDDTNPEKESKEYVEAIKDGLKWLGIPHGQETFTSDNMLAIYETAEKLIEKGKAYTCTCSQEQISKGREESKACACRSQTIEHHKLKWKQMIDGKFEESAIILRFMGNLNADNTVMRDPALARIIKTPHYRQGSKYCVWPGYDLAVCVMDHLEGITHSMRSKEYELRNELYYELYKVLGIVAPKLVEFSRLNIKNAPISKRLLTPLVKEKKVWGWDDPRLPTIKGLERRGLLPQAVKEFVLSFGLSKTESEPDWEALLSLNRKLLDPVSDHYFFVPDPVELTVYGMEKLGKKEINLKKHPKKESKGSVDERKFMVENKIFISKSDADLLKESETFRLKDLCNVKLTKKSISDPNSTNPSQIKLEGEFAADAMVDKKIQWVSGNKVECTILVPKDLFDGDKFNENSMQEIKGYCEWNCLHLKIGEIIQFERFGFCRVDEVIQPGVTKGLMVFVYSC